MAHTKKKKTERPCPTLAIQFAELKEERTSEGRTYIVWIPGFGNPGCTIRAKNMPEAKKIVGGFVGNELMAAEEL